MFNHLPEELLPPRGKSWKQILSKLSVVDQEEFLLKMDKFGDTLSIVHGDFFFEARREQIPPPQDWFIWAIMAGRGFGKTYAGSNWIINKHQYEGMMNSAVIAATAADLRRYCIEGPSGILTLAPKHFFPEYLPSKSKLVWPNGTETHLFTSEKPHRLRGANLDGAWCDELSYWKYVDLCWDNLMLSLRYGSDAQCVITMTPRPIPQIRELIKREREGTDTIITRGSTYDNKDNLSARFIQNIIDRYAGTRLGRQEIEGFVLDDVEGALWDHALIEMNREEEGPRKYLKKILGVDPAVTGGEKADMTGIVLAGLGNDKLGYVLGDFTLRASPNIWGTRVVSLYHLHECNLVVAEKNQGGELITELIHNLDKTVNVKLVHASKGKHTRAEPVAALYEQGRIKHVGNKPAEARGSLAHLEDEMCFFVPQDMEFSPDRVDALVWAMTELMVKPMKRAGTWGSRFRGGRGDQLAA